jgi:hypothetical protein
MPVLTVTAYRIHGASADASLVELACDLIDFFRPDYSLYHLHGALLLFYAAVLLLGDAKDLSSFDSKLADKDFFLLPTVP